MRGNSVITSFFSSNATNAVELVSKQIPKTKAELAEYLKHCDYMLSKVLVECNYSARSLDTPAWRDFTRHVSLGLYETPKHNPAAGPAASGPYI